MPLARRTRTQTRAIITHASAGESIDALNSANDLQGKKRRTSTSAQSSIATNSAPSATSGRYQKKTRKAGPDRGRPMQLQLTVEDEGDVQQQEHAAIDSGGGKGKGRLSHVLRNDFSLQCQPTTGNAALPPIPPHSDVETDRDESTGNGSGTDADTEEEWFADSAQLAELARKFPSGRMSEAIGIERPLWDISTDAANALSADVPAASPLLVPTSLPNDATMPAFAPESALASTPEPTRELTPTVTTDTPRTFTYFPLDGPYPVETDLIYVPGTRKVMLTAQRPVIRTVIQEAFEQVHASLLFDCAFPDASVVPQIIRDALVNRASFNVPRASNICIRLMRDDEYATRMARLPRARIPLFRREVKEQCAGIVQIEFLTVPLKPGQNIMHIVDRQLSLYLYTYPTSGQGHSLTALPMRTKPYRNPRIIAVIRELYFEGLHHSVARRCADKFPRHRGDDGTMIPEVPIPMLALVATALYAAIHEWRAGTHQTNEFSANAYMDVYQGHIDTLNHIRERRNNTFHLMMADIYSRANASDALGVPGVARAPIDLTELED